MAGGVYAGFEDMACAKSCASCAALLVDSVVLHASSSSRLQGSSDTCKVANKALSRFCCFC